MDIIKGKKLFDESTILEVKKATYLRKVFFLGFGIIFIVVAFSFLLPSFSIFGDLRPELDDVYARIPIVIMIFSMAVISILMYFGISDLIVYENGISMPSKSLLQIITIKENYIPFENIIEIYYYDVEKRPDIIIESSDDRKNRTIKWDISRKSIKDFTQFLNAISDKTKVRKY